MEASKSHGHGSAERDGPIEPTFCPHCGERLKRQRKLDRERPVCEACHYVWFPDPKVGVAAIVVRDDALLLVERRYPPEKGKWGLPGGFVDAGEDPAEGAAREALEETRLEVRIEGLFDVLHNREPGGASIVILYRATACGGELRAGDDAAAAVFQPLDDLPELAFASTRAVVSALRSGPLG